MYPGSRYYSEFNITTTYECPMACMTSPDCQRASSVLDQGLVCRLYDNSDQDLVEMLDATVFTKICIEGKEPHLQ